MHLLRVSHKTTGGLVLCCIAKCLYDYAPHYIPIEKWHTSNPPFSFPYGNDTDGKQRLPSGFETLTGWRLRVSNICVIDVVLLGLEDCTRLIRTLITACSASFHLLLIKFDIPSCGV